MGEVRRLRYLERQLQRQKVLGWRKPASRSSWSVNKQSRHLDLRESGPASHEGHLKRPTLPAAARR